MSLEACGISVGYIKFTTKRIFLHISSYFSADNDFIISDDLYRYDTKTHKLKKVLTIQGADYSSQCSVKKGKLYIEKDRTAWSVGDVVFTDCYEYKNGKFHQTNKSAKIESCHDYYKEIKEFTAAKSITFYQNAKLKKVAFRIKKGDKVKVKRIKLKKVKGENGYYWGSCLQFQYGNKKGWIDGDTSDIFKDVIIWH